MSHHPTTKGSAHSRQAESQAVDSPITCEYCHASAATQVFRILHPEIGVKNDFVCAPCGDWSEPYTLRIGKVWRFTLTPIAAGGGE